MSESQKIASYGFPMPHRVTVYPDKVVMGVFSYKTYWVEQIKSVNHITFLGFSSISLTLYDGTTTMEVSPFFRKQTAVRCVQQIERQIAEYRSANDSPGSAIIRGTFLGGTGVDFNRGMQCVVAFQNGTVRLTSMDQIIEVKLGEVTAIALHGPGTESTDAGLAGGGFGIEGALVGMGIATLVNSLTVEHRTNTVLYLSWPHAEVFVHTSQYDPEEARLVLSHAFTVVESMQRAGAPARSGDVPDLVAQIERLASLQEKGAITSEEYVSAKSKLLGRVE